MHVPTSAPRPHRAGYPRQIALACAIFGCATAAPAAAAALDPGDVVLVGSRWYPERGVWKVDPGTFAPTPITSGGWLVDPANVAVGAGGVIYIADAVSGIVRVLPASGAQDVVVTPADLGAEAPKACASRATAGST